jgi:penicillin-binding protein 1A
VLPSGGRGGGDRGSGRRGLPRLARALAALLTGLLAAAVTSCSYESTSAAPPLPEVAQTSRILAADGSLLTTLRSEQNRDVVRLADIPTSLRDAVIAIEDERFWLHPGVDLRGILRAARENVEAGGIAQGGSTITQQYVKLTLLDPTQTVNRKVREAVLAWRLEQTYSKEEILERYVNAIYLGRGAYGVGTAAQEYFGKPVGQLTVAEGALIAGLIRAPSANDPYVDPAPVVARRNVVLQRMAELGYLGPDQLAAAIAEPLHLAPPRPDAERYPAGHFVEAVKQWILGDPRFGPTEDDRRNLLFRGGLRVTTTLDPALQAMAEQAVSDTLPGDGAHPDGALVTIEPATGNVKAMVGGRDYFGTTSYAKVNLAMGDGRQAGSTFKPFVLAAALSDGIPLTRTYAAPAGLEIPLGDGLAPWKVQNYGGARAGNVSLTEATVWSYNTAYARLMMDLGPAKAVDMASRLGIRTPLHAVPAAVLGTENVTVLDMADAYATFANRGLHVTPVLVTSITRADGTVLYRSAPETAPVLDPAVADQVTWVLRQVIGRGTGTAAGLDRPSAGKTGTAEAYRDAWFVGYTPDLATAVWVGDAQGQTPMVPPTTPIAVTGGSWPAQIWHQFMAPAEAPLPVRDFADPDPATLRRIEASRATTVNPGGPAADDGADGAATLGGADGAATIGLPPSTSTTTTPPAEPGGPDGGSDGSDRPSESRPSDPGAPSGPPAVSGPAPPGQSEREDTTTTTADRSGQDPTPTTGVTPDTAGRQEAR